MHPSGCITAGLDDDRLGEITGHPGVAPPADYLVEVRGQPATPPGLRERGGDRAFSRTIELWANGGELLDQSEGVLLHLAARTRRRAADSEKKDLL
jgi:hypothetical protein